MAARKKKTGLDHAVSNIGKQINEVEGSSLGERQQAQIVDFLTGVQCVIGDVSQVVDPENPPAPESLLGLLIARGRNERVVLDMLSGGGGADTADAGSPTPPAEGQAPAATPPQDTADVGI
jgi:hypothetical protein